MLINPNLLQNYQRTKEKTDTIMSCHVRSLILFYVQFTGTESSFSASSLFRASDLKLSHSPSLTWVCHCSHTARAQASGWLDSRCSGEPHGRFSLHWEVPGSPSLATYCWPPHLWGGWPGEALCRLGPSYRIAHAPYLKLHGRQVLALCTSACPFPWFSTSVMQ